MNLFDIASQHNKNLFSSIRSKMVLFSLSKGEDEDLSEHLSAVSGFMDKIHSFVISEAIELANEEFRLYSKKGLKEFEYYAFKPHLYLGYSPFVFYRENNKIKGCYISIRHVKSEWCRKTMNKLADKYFTEMYKKDEYVTKQDAKIHIEENLAKNNKDNIPLVEKYSDILFYIDVERGYLLSKSSQRDREAFDAFYPLLLNIVTNEQFAKLKLVDDFKEEVKSRLGAIPYTRKAMGDGDACSAYDLTSLVNFYANQGNEDGELPLEPTWSAQLYHADNTKQKMSFGESINLFLENPCDVDVSPTFSQISNFAEDKALRFSELKVKGELRRGEFLKDYFEQYGAENDLPSTFESEFIDVLYSTQSKEGNICIQIRDNLELHKDAMLAFLRSELNDRHFSKSDFETHLSNYQGRVLDLLHNSIDLFVSLYLTYAAVGEEFGEATVVDKLLSGTMENEDDNVAEEDKLAS